MGDHVVVHVDRLITLETPESGPGGPSGEGPSLSSTTTDLSSPENAADKAVYEQEVSEEDKPLLQIGECRICQEEDHIKNLETPCACSGSLKYAHRKCLQLWCNEKGDTTCEICHQQYKPGYTAPPPRPQADETAIDISGGWAISGTTLDLHDPRLLAMAAAERHFLESEYDEYAATNASGAAFCRSAALILMALLLLRHALTITNPDGDEDASTFFSEAAALAAAELAFVLQSGRARGLQLTVAPAAALAAREPFQ